MECFTDETLKKEKNNTKQTTKPKTNPQKPSANENY